METISSNREKAKDRDSVGKPDEHSEVSEAMQADPLNSETENTRDTEIRGWPDCETGECGQGETVRSGPEPGAGVCGALYCTPDRREGRSRNRKDKDSWSPVCAICWEYRKVKPSDITAVTFTNQAAAEMRERIERANRKRNRRHVSCRSAHFTQSVWSF